MAGDGTSDNAWLSGPLSFAPNTVYRLQFQARRVRGSGGLPVSGPLFCNRDLGALDQVWTPCESFFVTPRQLDKDQARLRFGQWEVPGEVAFDDVRLDRVVPVYRSQGGCQLGDGEVIQSGHYIFRAPLGKASANHARPLAWQQCQFNSNRWVLSSPDTVVVYHHDLGRAQSDVTVQVEIGWYQGGELLVEVSREGEQWQPVGTSGSLGSQTFRVPGNMLPATELWVRLSARKKAGEEAPAALQLYGYVYEANLAGERMDLVGATQYFAISQDDPKLNVAIQGMGDATTGEQDFIDLRLQNQTSGPLVLNALVTVTPVAESASPAPLSAPIRQAITLAAGEENAALRVPYTLSAVRRYRIGLAITGDATFAADTSVEVPALHAAHYGAALPSTDESLGLWWCSSGWKVGVRRPTPTATAPAMVIRAAANEAEAAQLVLRPGQPLRNLTVSASDLAGPDSSQIPAARIDILQVRYVHVTQPTDASGTTGLWPDPLPRLTDPVDLTADRNFPLWIRVRVPKAQPPGVYRGTISLHAEGISETVPLQVEVFGFELPDRMTCKTAFGFDTSLVSRYHRLQTEPQQREVLDKYFRCLSEHHISPYESAPFDPIEVTWKNLPAWGGGERDEQHAYAGKASLRITDDSTHDNVSAQYHTPIPAAQQGLLLSFWYRTREADQPFLVTLRHFDAAQRWLSGRNNDLRIEGSTEWRHVELKIEQFPADARSVLLDLRATLWREDGALTGTAWFDEVSVVDQSTGEQRIIGGGFEATQQPTPQPEFDFTRWDQAMTRAIDELHFNTFRLPVPGLGGGTFHERYEPQLLGYSQDTPQYREAMKAYLGQLESHLRDKGWLDEAFVYWFDEPDPKDYEFVNNGFATLKQWAPAINRMLTEQVEPALIGGPNIWCPLTASYDQESAEQRRAAGEEFWWYVCTGPQAPYCTLFIDHPGTEMRVWLWQTWQRQIAGILVWETNYWTSSAAYPDPSQPQNPYTDPMSWVSGYSTPDGSRRPWGNGDGRFVYPPEAAADGRPAESVLEGPVECLRLEMLRDGIEDYEYLTILRNLLHSRAAHLTATQRTAYEALLAVPPQITSGITNFTIDPAPIEERRQEVARAVVELLQLDPT